MQLRQDNLQRQSQKLAPHLIQANTLLQCSTTELMQIIEQEQRENPALDTGEEALDHDGGCPGCSSQRVGTCAHCPFSREAHPLAQGQEPAEASLAASLDPLVPPNADEAVRTEEHRQADRNENDLSHGGLDEGWDAASGGDPDFDPIMMARVEDTLEEQLLLHLRATSNTPDEARVAEYLVDCLDERGYLHVNLDEAEAILRVPCSLIIAGIERLQACDPPGVGARDLRECLLLQIRFFQEQNGAEPHDPIAERLLSDHWEALVQRRHTPLPRRLNVTPERIQAALAFIQSHLTPHPAGQFRTPWDHRPNTHSNAVRADVLIKRTPEGFAVEVQGTETVPLQVNPHYRALYEQIRASRARKSTGEAPALSLDHETHVIAYVERANSFLKNLQQRRRTIQKITQALIEHQQGFLDTGKRAFLRSLTRTRLAQEVGMHESTVSRALLYKYVQLPTQEVVSFDVFFENAVNAKDTVAALIEDEDRDAPLSDQAIRDILAKRGMDVARRTVVKYREELRLPASYLRRRH